MRKTKTVTIATPGRDEGKNFLITEMDAAQAEKWALRVFNGMLVAGLNLPQEMTSRGMAGIAMAGMQGLFGMPWHLQEPLLDELLRCVTVMPDPTRIDQVTKLPFVRPIGPEDIEEFMTRTQLRAEAFDLMTGFSTAGALSKLRSAAAEQMNASADTQTSPSASE